LVLPADTRLAPFWIAPPLSRLHSTPLYRLPLGPRFGLVLMLAVALVPHPLPLTVTGHFFFSSTDAILLSKLCLYSVLSGWIKVSYIITLVLEPNIPFPRARAPSQLNAVVIRQVIYSLRKAPYVLRLSLLVTILSTHVLVVLLSSTSSSPMIGV
jgi:hypothetical protein